MNDGLGFALIGCGDIGGLNARSIAEAKGASLVRLVDTNLDAAGVLAERFNVPLSTPGSGATSPMEDALNDANVDAVFIATPHDLHASMVALAARAGKHVIVEKPIATNVRDAEAAIATCDECGVSLSVCHPRRYEEKIIRARALVEEGLVGRVLVTVSKFLKNKGPDYWSKAPWRSDRSRSGGGVVIMNLVHHLDALQAITGHRLVEAVGLTGPVAGAPCVEDAAAVAARFDGGAVAALAACTTIPGKKVFEDEIFGEKGRLVVEKRSVRLQTNDSYVSGSPGQWTVFEFEEDSTSKRGFIEAFVKSVLADKPPPVPGGYGLDLLRIVSQVYDHSGTNPIALGEREP